MLSRIKDGMKDWLIEHERLYWYIVVGLAVFAFVVISMLGLAKLEKAEAAVGDYYDNVMAMRDESKPYYALFYMKHSFGYEYLVFFESDSDVIIPLTYLNDGSGERLVVKSGRGYTGYYNDGYHKDVLITWYLSDYYSISYIEGNMSWAADVPMSGENWSIVDARPIPIVEAFVPVGPYLRLNDDYYYNTPYTISAHDNESVAGVPMLGNCPVGNWKWIYKGSIGGSLKDYEGTETDVISNVKVQSTIDVGIPSRAWVADCIENMELAGLRELRTVEKRNEWVKARFKNGNMEDCIISFSSNLFVTADNKDFELTFKYTDMLEQVRETLGIDNWAEYYECTDVQWDEFWSHIVFGYLTVNQMDSIVFNQYSDTNIMYGCYVSDVFTSGYNYSGYVYQDFFADSQACFDAMKTELQEAYESVLAESEKKLEEYQAELDSINKELEILRADDTALFDIFTKLANGLKNVTVGLRSLSVAIGNIFAFLPQEILLCYNFAFCAILLVSIVKAIRG